MNRGTKIKGLTLAEIEYVAHDLAQKIMAWNEPIPEFKTRRPSILEIMPMGM